MRLHALHAGLLEVATRVARGVEQVVVPNACAFCGGSLPLRVAPVCGGCWLELPWTNARFHLEPFTVALAPLDYEFPVDAAIKRFKFRRKLFYAPAFAYLCEAAIQELPDSIDAVLPMPLHWRRQALRGFNQAAEISRSVARIIGLPVIDNVSRCRHTPYQSGLPAAQRRRNLKHAFRVNEPVEYGHVLVVDDVVTTGATCRELGRVLLDAGVEQVSVLAVARTHM